jgi:hypothetical protein
MSSLETDQIDWSTDLARRADLATGRTVIRSQPWLRATAVVSCSRRAPYLLRTSPTAAYIGGRVDDAQTRARLDVLRIEHRDLDDAIAALSLASTPNQLQMARLKKRKLRLRDEIVSLEDMLIPDIIA